MSPIVSLRDIRHRPSPWISSHRASTSVGPLQDQVPPPGIWLSRCSSWVNADELLAGDVRGREKLPLGYAIEDLSDDRCPPNEPQIRFLANAAWVNADKFFHASSCNVTCSLVRRETRVFAVKDDR